MMSRKYQTKHSGCCGGETDYAVLRKKKATQLQRLMLENKKVIVELKAVANVMNLQPLSIPLLNKNRSFIASKILALLSSFNSAHK